MSARIVVLDGQTANPGDHSWPLLAALGEVEVFERTEPGLVLERARGADVLVTNKTALDAATLSALPGLRGISVLATGVDIVDVAAARSLGIRVCNVPAYSTASVVEHTFALILELARRVGLHDVAVHDGAWAKSQDFCFWLTPQRELAGSQLGVVGYGAIGRRVADVGLSLGMRVVATPSRRAALESGVSALDLDALFATSDVVSLHCPLTDATRGMVNEQRLLRMKRTAFLINTSRGGLVVEQDLARALARGEIAGAALDVLSEEPPAADNPLLLAPSCIVTPHLAWTTLAARQRLLAVTADNVRGILAGTPVNVVVA